MVVGIEILGSNCRFMFPFVWVRKPQQEKRCRLSQAIPPREEPFKLSNVLFVTGERAHLKLERNLSACDQ